MENRTSIFHHRGIGSLNDFEMQNQTTIAILLYSNISNKHNSFTTTQLNLEYFLNFSDSVQMIWHRHEMPLIPSISFSVFSKKNVRFKFIKNN